MLTTTIFPIKLSNKQKEQIGKFLLDISKIILAVFVIGGLLPESRITGLQIFVSIVEAIAFFCTAPLLELHLTSWYNTLKYQAVCW